MIVRLIKIMISATLVTINFLWKPFYRLFCLEIPNNFVAIYYHAVTKGDRNRFARQLDDLLKWSNIVAIRNELVLKKGVINLAITFDDGFISVVSNALPELTKRKIPSLIFIPTGYLGQKPTWSSKSKDRLQSEWVISIDQMKKLKSDLVTFGSHTVSHSKLTLLSEKEAIEELLASKKTLETILDSEISTLSFPYGEYNETLVCWARKIGYKFIFNSIPSLAFSDPQKDVLGRVQVKPSDWRFELWLKVRGAYRWLPKVSALKHKIIFTFKKTSELPAIPISKNSHSVQVHC